MLKLLLPALCVAVAAAAAGLARGGDPDRGAVVWVSNGCAACHTLKKTGSTGTSGPNLDRWLIPDARRLKTTPADLTGRRIYWGGRGMPNYGATLSAQDLDDLVSFLTGGGFTGPGTPIASIPAPPPLVTASAATVKRWVAKKRLGPRAASGAVIFAKTGCLSCHTYLGSGTRRRGAPDLTRHGGSAAAIAAYVARPYLKGNTLMPMYADIGADALSRIGAFLSASR